MLGNICKIIDSVGNVVVQYKYDAWGNHTIETAEPSYLALAELNPFRYRSYYYDTDLELYYLKTRYYDAEIGRFITIDDISVLDTTREYANGINLYAYCFNNPVNATDEDGNMPKWLKWLLGVIIIVAAIALSVVTAGIATPISAALGGGFIGSIVGGAVAGAIGGAITSFGFNIAIQGISKGFNNIDWGQVGIQTAIGAATGAILGAIGGGIKYTRAANYLKSNGVTDVKSVLKNFKGVPSLKTSNGVYAYRYYDNIAAKQVGRWLTNSLTSNPIKELVLYNNNATMVSKFLINEGTKFLVGRIANSSVNALQYYVANTNWITLLF